MKFAVKKLTGMFPILILLLVISCSDNDTVTTNDNYNGPGSQWTATLNSGRSFTMNEAESGLAISGTWRITDGGFKELTVTASNNTGSVAVGSKAYAIDIPGVVLLVKPFSGTQIISMVKAGECPQADVSANWIVTKVQDGSDVSSRDVTGTFAYTHATTSANLPTKYQVDGTAIAYNGATDNLGSFVCSGGVADVSDAKMYLTQIGAAIVHTNGGSPADSTDDDFIVALPPKTIGSLSALDGTYKGLVFSQSVGVDELFPVQITLSNGTGSGNEVNPDTGVLDVDPVAFNLTAVDTPSAGFLTGTVGAGQVQCMANTNINNSGKNFIFCIGQNPGELTKLYNMLMIN